MELKNLTTLNEVKEYAAETMLLNAERVGKEEIGAMSLNSRLIEKIPADLLGSVGCCFMESISEVVNHSEFCEHLRWAIEKVQLTVEE